MAIYSAVDGTCQGRPHLTFYVFVSSGERTNFRSKRFYEQNVVLFHSSSKNNDRLWRNIKDQYYERHRSFFSTSEQSRAFVGAMKHWMLIFLKFPHEWIHKTCPPRGDYYFVPSFRKLCPRILLKKNGLRTRYNNNNYYEPGKEWQKFRLVYGRDDKQWSGQGASSAHRTYMRISFPIGIRRSTSLPLTVHHPPPTSAQSQREWRWWGNLCSWRTHSLFLKRTRYQQNKTTTTHLRSPPQRNGTAHYYPFSSCCKAAWSRHLWDRF